jgi:hypothetical protein
MFGAKLVRGFQTKMLSVLVFCDFEASGLPGLPVDVGWAWLDGSAVKSDRRPKG